ncbi:MAG: HEAT repeat domain-containing protein [Desulfobacterales bacterium]|nr:HEAT repeat domain-containing protein [Desulfobacterales bacterium]
MQKGENNHKGFIKSLSLLIFFVLLFPANAFLQDKKGVEELIGGLQAEKPLVRRDAAEQLGKAKDARGVEPLIQALRDEDEGVRREVTKALGEIGDSRALKPLGEMLEDTDEFVRVNALGALERIGGDEAVDLIVAGLKNANPLVRMSASASLGRIGNKRAIPTLEGVAKNDALSYVRFAAEQALVQLRGETIVKAPEQERTQRVATDETGIPSIAELKQVAERIKGHYGLILDYQKYDIMDLLDIEARMRMMHPRDTMEGLLGDLLTQEDKERNRHLFEPKQ